MDVRLDIATLVPAGQPGTGSALAFVCAVDDPDWPDHFVLTRGHAPPSAAPGSVDATRLTVILPAALARTAMEKEPEPGIRHHLPPPLRAVVLAIRDCMIAGEAGRLFRFGKALELVGQLAQLVNAERAMPVRSAARISSDMMRRMVRARRLIEERCGEKLTLDMIARHCGLSRPVLTTSFRAVFGCSVYDMLHNRRLDRASTQLRSTDLPVATIGFDNGYESNASFSRAFARRFGLTPTGFRTGQRAATVSAIAA